MSSVQSLKRLYERAVSKFSLLAVAQHKCTSTSWTPKMEGDYDNDFQLPFLDRLSKLIIGSAHFERCYRAAMIKYARTGNLKNLSLDFSITNGSFLADPYADGELGSDGMWKMYWRGRRMTTRPGISVRWVFEAKNGQGGDGEMEQSHSCSSFQNPCYDGDPDPIVIQPTVSHIGPLGQILDQDGSITFELQSMPTHHHYMISRPNSIPFLEIHGEPHWKAWAAKASGMARTSMTFQVYDARPAASKCVRKRLLATLEPIIDGVSFKSDGNSKDGLLLIKYTPKCETREVKAVILGAALLLCQRYYMKKLHQAFEDVTTKNLIQIS